MLRKFGNPEMSLGEFMGIILCGLKTYTIKDSLTYNKVSNMHSNVLLLIY